ncbi:hypothetical protein diail_7060, partial [Diaporthe ilicicola]
MSDANREDVYNLAETTLAYRPTEPESGLQIIDWSKLNIATTALLDGMLDGFAKKRAEKVDFGWGDVQQESLGALFAGSDTTAITFRSLFYHLMHTPAAYEKPQAEIDQAFEDGRLSAIPTFQEASKLPYLDACIKEALRSYPGAQL